MKKKNLMLYLCARMCVLFTLLLLISAPLTAQTGTRISGTVNDSKGMAAAAVTVAVKGTETVTITDDKGNYSIAVKPGQVLRFTAVGFETQEVAFKGQSRIDLSLTKSYSRLDDVVVVGYGTTTKKEVTSAITTLKPADFNKGNIGNPVGLLQGRVAGLNIARPAGGDVNGNFDIQLRGLTTLSGGQGPLFVIDGILGGDL
ncbi:MAG: SusC/RagA family, partial [Sediminibacterium sp.]|nr:SusC/RagA family [Sediminibacterium sp.]